ncbi:TRAP transporter small permease [Desulfocurvus vexinensis]|uniref:TRAP transporter small permease n=1 Tax=Desulfocurvus vexinensis TaxID=399548 RepID=UPI0009FBB3A1|nr:TRAP transporter small permease [Desulfocurvus vexinensis]
MSRLAQSCKTASDVLERLCLFGAGALLAINLATVMLGVFSRFFRPPMWTTDVAKITLVWMVMLAAAPALKRGEHMAITMLADRLPPGRRAVVVWLRGAVFVGLLVLMTVLGFQYAAKMQALTIMTLGITKTVPLLAVPVGMALMLVQFGLGLFSPAPGDGQGQGGTP